MTRGDGDTNEKREVLFQPASPRDLDRYPAMSEDCATVRGMLRDYADHDLPATLATRVEAHVHSCRDCALALSRTELEVVRISRSLESDRAGREVPSGFVSRVMARVADESLAGDDAPADFTNQVMDRVRKEWSDPTPWSRVRRFATARVLAVPAIALLICGVVAVWLGAPAPRVPVVVLTATDGQIDARSAVDGEVLPVGATLATDDIGGVTLGIDAHAFGRPDASPGISLARLEAHTELRHMEFGLWLLEGAVEFEIQRPLVVPVDDLALLRLGPGQYHVGVDPVRRFDRDVHPMTRGRRVTVDVVEGQAEIFRGRDQQQLLTVVSADPAAGYLTAATAEVVRSGYVAAFDQLSALELDPRLDLASLGNGPRAAPFAPRVDRPSRSGLVSWRGRVLEGGTGQGVAGIEIDIATAGGSRKVRTDADGFYGFDDLDSDAVVVVATVPAVIRDGASSLAAFGPRPLRQTAGNGVRTIHPIVLEEDVAVSGRVRALDDGWLAGARVTPVIVDELFGRVDEVAAPSARTDADGRFELHGLPTALEPYRLLALLIEHSDFPTAAHLGLGRRLDAATFGTLDVVVSSPRPRVLEGLLPGAEVTILEAVPGIPVSTLATTHVAVADPSGRVRLAAAGPGPFFAVDAEARSVRAFDGSIARAESDLAFAWIEPLLEKPGVSSGPGRRRRAVSGHRYQPPRHSIEADPVQRLDVLDAVAQAVPLARLFARGPRGEIVFLGEYDGVNGVPFHHLVDSPYTLIAVDPSQGQIGVVPIADRTIPIASTVVVEAPGVGVVAAETRPVAGEMTLVQLRRTDGPLDGQVTWRAVGPGTDWKVDGLAPGTYRVRFPDGRETTCEVRSGEEALIKVE